MVRDVLKNLRNTDDLNNKRTIEVNMSKLPKLVTIDEANSVWGNAKFGDVNMDKLAYIKQALDKVSRGYRNGWTITQILMELKLLTPKRRCMTIRGYHNLINL